MALYSGVEAYFIVGAGPEEMQTDIETYIETLDSTTNPVLAIVPYRGGVLVISGT